MKKLTFYEQVGIVIPGAMLLFGLLFYFPALKDLLAKDGVTVGELGIFVLLSYASGHAVAAVGNLVENVLWRPLGGMPSYWITRARPTFISPAQIAQVEARLKSRLGLDVTIRGLDRRTGQTISAQIYADVMTHGKSERVDTFNGNYGLSRGLCASALVLAVIAAVQRDWCATVGLIALAGIYLYRAHRFGVHYARELYLQFLLLDNPVTASDK
jgi:hypothetical protein